LFRAREPIEVPMRFQKYFLNDVGGIDLGLKAAADLQPGQQQQVVAVALQKRSQGLRRIAACQSQKVLGIRGEAMVHGRHLHILLVPEADASRREK
jgi:hypothetical protein